MLPRRDEPSEVVEDAHADQTAATLGPKRNAFSELMSPKAKQSKSQSTRASSHIGKLSNPDDSRSGLLPYILQPERFDESLVVSYNDKAVVIKDAFPKATVHLLVLPRDASKWDLNPRDAFDDADFLADVRTEAAEALRLAASELSRLIAPSSAACKKHLEGLESDDPSVELPPGRDFTKDFNVGIHAHPSMHHLHVHIISHDMHSDRLKHQKHYNSFNTEFFIPLEDFPLSKDDPRRQISYQNANLKKEYKCWRCGKLYGNQFKKLKEHLEQEFLAWKKE
jgi:aprataxin